MDMSSDPKVVDGVVGTMLHILKAAAREPSIRRVVYTSSAAACVLGTPWCTTHIEADTYDEEAIQAVRGPRDPNMDPRLLLGHIYGASKAEAEKACWRFMKEQNPTFELNTVVPDANFGPVLYKGKATSTVSWLEKVFRGDMTMANFMGSRKYPFLYFPAHGTSDDVDHRCRMVRGCSRLRPSTPRWVDQSGREVRANLRLR